MHHKMRIAIEIYSQTVYRSRIKNQSFMGKNYLHNFQKLFNQTISAYKVPINCNSHSIIILLYSNSTSRSTKIILAIYKCKSSTLLELLQILRLSNTEYFKGNFYSKKANSYIYFTPYYLPLFACFTPCTILYFKTTRNHEMRF